MILGIDPGINKMGLCEIIDNKYTSEVIKAGSLPKKTPPEISRLMFFKYRLANNWHIHNGIAQSSLVVIESPFNVPGYGKVLIEVLGTLKYICIIHEADFCEVPQTTLKKFATGSGKAEKSQMVLKASKEFQFEAETEDEVDAFWLAQVGNCLIRPEQYTKQRQEAVSKIKIMSPKQINDYDFKEITIVKS